ncbi:MAG: hypothetical protein H0X46_03680 [Bacteroidetes bacterium]|nr:hypothetical protein [Bacteroidota bacterium]
MRKAEFEVPSEVMAEFADEMVNRDLDNKVTGTNEDNEILVEVIYEKEESKSVDELEKILDNLREQMEEEDEEEEEDEDQ